MKNSNSHSNLQGTNPLRPSDKSSKADNSEIKLTNQSHKDFVRPSIFQQISQEQQVSKMINYLPEHSTSPCRPHTNKAGIMSKSYIQSFKANKSSNLSKYSRSSIQKKDISDSNLQFEDMEESCIVLDDSHSQQENMKNIQTCVQDLQQHRQTQQQIGRVGMSSKMSSKISLKLPNSSLGLKQIQQSQCGVSNSLEFNDASKLYQKSIFNDTLNNFVSQTMDSRQLISKNDNQFAQTTNFHSFGNPARNTKLSCFTMNNNQKEDLNETRHIMQNNFSNSVVPTIILAQSVRGSVKPSQKLLMSPDCSGNNENIDPISTDGKRVTHESQKTNMKSAQDQSQAYGTSEINRNIPEGSSNFMQSTSSKNECHHQIPNEISENSEMEEVDIDYVNIKDSQLYQQATPLNRPSNPAMANHNQPAHFQQSINQQSLTHQKKSSKFDINVFHINQMNNDALDKQFYYQIPTNQRDTLQSQISEDRQFQAQFLDKQGNMLHSSKTEIEQQILQEMNEEFQLENQTESSAKEYLQSNFNSNNTEKISFDMQGNSLNQVESQQIQSDPSNESSSMVSKLSKIRQELQFPQIQMNKIQYYADQFNFNEYQSENSSNMRQTVGSGSDNIIQGASIQNVLTSGNDSLKNLEIIDDLRDNKLCQELIQQISLQPSIQGSENKKSGKSQSILITSQTGNSMLEEMCQEISDIHLPLEESNNLHHTKTTNADNQSADSFSTQNKTNKNHIESMFGPKHQQSLNEQYSLGFQKQQNKLIDPRQHHQTYLFSENHNEEDFQIPQGQGQGSSLSVSEQKDHLAYNNSKDDKRSNQLKNYAYNASGPEEIYNMISHINKKSSFGGNIDQNSFAKGGMHPHQQTTALLENSCVTFQYYNSSKFASNSTNKDHVMSKPHNCFYMTNTTESNENETSQYNSKESDKSKGGETKQYQHKRVQDIILLNDEYSDSEDNQMQANLQNQIIQERSAQEEESQTSMSQLEIEEEESMFQGEGRGSTTQPAQSSSISERHAQMRNDSKIQSGKSNEHIKSIQQQISQFNVIDKETRNHIPNICYDLEAQSLADQRSHDNVLDSGALGQQTLKSAHSTANLVGLGTFQFKQHSASSQKEFCVESNDQSYTILQAASVSNKKQQNKYKDNVLHVIDSRGNLQTTETPGKCLEKCAPFGQLITESDDLALQKSLSAIDKAQSQISYRAKQDSTESKARNDSIKQKLFFEENLKQVQIKETTTKQVQEPEIIIGKDNNDMNIIQYPSEMEQSQNVSQTKDLSLVQENTQDLNVLFSKLNTLTALCQNDQSDQQEGSPQDEQQNLSQFSDTLIQQRIQKLSSNIAEINNDKQKQNKSIKMAVVHLKKTEEPDADKDLLTNWQEREKSDLEEFKSHERHIEGQSQIESDDKFSNSKISLNHSNLEEKVLSQQELSMFDNLIPLAKLQLSKQKSLHNKARQASRNNNSFQKPQLNTIQMVTGERQSMELFKQSMPVTGKENSSFKVSENPTVRQGSKWQQQFRSRSKSGGVRSNLSSRSKPADQPNSNKSVIFKSKSFVIQKSMSSNKIDSLKNQVSPKMSIKDKQAAKTSPSVISDNHPLKHSKSLPKQKSKTFKSNIGIGIKKAQNQGHLTFNHKTIEDQNLENTSRLSTQKTEEKQMQEQEMAIKKNKGLKQKKNLEKTKSKLAKPNIVSVSLLPGKKRAPPSNKNSESSHEQTQALGNKISCSINELNMIYESFKTQIESNI